MHAALAFITIVAVSGFAPATKIAKFRSSNAHERFNGALKMGQKVAIPNPFKALPWNVKKEMEREGKRYKMENAKLHRQLGISEDATFEEITAVTEKLIRAANEEGDVKKKIKAEIAKDRIMQIRLNERLAGLSKVTDDAKAQSRREEEEEDDDDLEDEKPKEWGAPKWSEGLIKKPDPEWRNKNIKVFGGMTLLGFVFPPMAPILTMLNGYFTAGMLSRRGMRDNGAGVNMMEIKKSSPSQRKAVLLSFGFWIFIRVFVMSLGKVKYMFGARYVPVVELAIMNLLLGFFVSYVQTYKGA